MGGSGSRVESGSLLAPTEIEVIFDFRSRSDRKKVDVHIYIDADGNRKVDKDNIRELTETMVHFCKVSGNKEKMLESLVVNAQRKVADVWYPYTEAEPFEYDVEKVDAIVAQMKAKLYLAMGVGEFCGVEVLLDWQVPVASRLNAHLTKVMKSLAKTCCIKWKLNSGQWNSTAQYMLENIHSK